MICRHCHRPHSKFGLGLVMSELPDGTPDHATCVECGQKHGWNWFPNTMPAIFEMVDRIPWVPTEYELSFWKFWRIDHWFARRA